MALDISVGVGKVITIGMGVGDSLAGRVFMRELWLNFLNAAGMALGGVQHHCGSDRTGGTTDEHGEDSQNDLPTILCHQKTLRHGL